jgi:1-acyl-sn-glycerol-3-phosphate acyltransferase
MTPVLWMLLVPTRVSAEGKENVPRQGPLIFIYNHLGFIDPGAVCYAVPRFAVPLAKAETLKYPLLGKAIEWYPVIPIHRGELDMPAMRWADSLLAARQALMIAPEGTRSTTGGLQTPKDGFVFFARRHDPAIVPVAVTGVTDYKSYWRRLRRTPVHVRFGQPFKFQWPERKRVDKEIMKRMADEAMYRIAALLPAELRGVYADLGQATTEHITEVTS